MTDDELLGAILRRFLTDDDRPFFYIGDDLTLDGKVEVTDDELKALLRATAGKLDGPGIAGRADPRFYATT